MKKFCIIAIICALCLTTLLAGCKKDESTLPSFAGELSVSNNILTWAEQEGATSYAVRVKYDDYNGYEVPVLGTSYPLTLYKEGSYVLTVRAVTSSGYTEYSAPYTYTVSKDVIVTPTDEEGVVLRGDGSKDNPLLIYTAKELDTITTGTAKDESGTKRQLYYRLESDIDLAGAEWKPIGDHTAPFGGVFDGNGHTISHWVQTKAYDSASYYNNGFFGRVADAVIVNLTLTDFSINPGVVNYTIDIGGLVGSANNTTIENCAVDGTIVLNRTLEAAEKARVGMLLGHASQASVSTRIERCTTKGSINVRFAGVYAGGLIGVVSPSHAHIYNNYADVDITLFGTAVTNKTTKSYTYGGQLIGFVSSVGDIDGNVGVGRVQVGARDGTPVEYIGKGVMGSVYHPNTTSGIVFTNVYFDYTALDVTLGDPFDTEEEIAQYYAVGGGVTKQNDATSVYARTLEELGDPNKVSGLDMDVWEIVDGVLRLKAYHSEFYTVTYQVGDEVIGTQVVLKGQPATCPFDYKGTAVVFVKWDYDDAPITQDTIINAITR